jgi:hypothetical protein
MSHGFAYSFEGVFDYALTLNEAPVSPRTNSLGGDG